MHNEEHLLSFLYMHYFCSSHFSDLSIIHLYGCMAAMATMSVCIDVARSMTTRPSLDYVDWTLLFLNSSSSDMVRRSFDSHMTVSTKLIVGDAWSN